jgi:large conductance mechanosensitive channel
MKKLMEEFKAFIAKGNVIDLAVGVMIGGAFGKIVTSLVSDMFMPLIGLLLGGLNLSGAFVALDGNAYPSIEAAQAAGVGTLNYGAFIQTIIDFLIIAVCVFFFVKLVTRLMPHKKEAPKPAPRLCPYCQTEIPEKATRCPHCTSQLEK